MFAFLDGYIFTLFFSDKYMPSAPALGVLMIINSIGLISTILDASYTAHGQPVYLILVNSLVAVINVIGNFILIPVFGFMGSVYARLIAELVGNPISYLLARAEKIQVKLSLYLKPALIFFACLIVYYIFDVQAVLLKAAVLLAYLALSAAFSVVTVRDIRTVLTSMRLIPQRS